VIVLLQWRANAFESEFGGEADEPAHYVTGLMLRDYIAQGFPGAPLAFARNYYVHYPKVALGHWPPLFYVVQSAWTLAFTPGRASVMLLMAFITALLLAVLYAALRAEFPAGLAAGGAGLLLSLPIIQQFSRDVMTEMLLALVVLLATLAYGAYLDTERWQAAAWFGIWFALALLAKGTAIHLAWVPPAAILITGRWRLLGRFSFWLPAILVCAIAGPWYLWVPGAQHESVARFGGVHFASARVIGSFVAWAKMLGGVPSVLAIVGIAMAVPQLRKRSGIWTAGLALLIGAYLSRLAIGAYEDRHLIVNLPVLILFAALPVSWLLNQRVPKSRWTTAAGALALAALLAFNLWASPRKKHFGYSEVAQNILSHAEFAHSVILTCGDAEGEGMLISEIAMHESRPGHIILRGTKMLASSDWMGRDYRALFHDSKEMLEYLERIPVGIVVIDDAGRRTPHGLLLTQGIQAHPEKWQKLADSKGNILVYRLIGHENRPVEKIQVPMRSGLYGTFSN